MKYKFVRSHSTSPGNVEDFLNEFTIDGWRVISHAKDGGTEHLIYSFVLGKD
jgi:hypothetical protein